MPLEPGRLQFALGHLPGHDDLEGPLAEGEFGQVVAGVAEVVGQQAVELVALPVEFFLQGDHLASDRVGLRSGRPPDRSACGMARCTLASGKRCVVVLAERDLTDGQVRGALISGRGNVRRPVPVNS